MCSYTYKYVYVCIYIYIYTHTAKTERRRACSFAQYSLFYRTLFAKETYNFKQTTNRSRAIPLALYKTHTYICLYGVATISRLLKIISLFCRI